MNDFLSQKFYKKKKGQQRRQKGEENKSDPIHGQYTNACKLGANLRDLNYFKNL